jgi:hypothetical protein
MTPLGMPVTDSPVVAVRRMIERLPGGRAARATFEPGYLARCAFGVGDRVCGVYVVRSRASRRASSVTEVMGYGSAALARRVGAREVAVLDLSPPEGWTGPVVQGRLVFAVEVLEGEDGEDERVRIVNETVLWRRIEEKKVFLEGAVGRWFHGLMVQWMVARGMGALVAWDSSHKTEG